MAYTGTNSTYQTPYSNVSRSGFPRQQDEHIYEEQPYYANDRSTSRQSIGADDRQTQKVCQVFIFV